MALATKQRGVALLVLALIFVVGVGAFLYARLGKWRDATTASRRVNGEVLAQAKAALIGYVAKEVLDLGEDTPGRFPCPESPTDAGTVNEGRAGSSCLPTFPTNKNIGRLPWRTLGIDKLVDASGEPLWYAVSSPNWVYSGATPVINAGTPGQLSFDGTTDVVAVIFAPGPALLVNPIANQLAAGCAARSQSRNDRSHVPTGANPDYRDYLECLNASSPIGAAFGTAIVDNATNQVINDQAVYITAKEILNAMQGPVAERLQRTVAPLLSEFGDKWVTGAKLLPYAVTFSPPEAALPANSHCGAGGQDEGLLPIADNSGSCATTWSTASVSGNGITSLGCTTPAAPNPVVCSLRYYTLTVLGLLSFSGASSVTAVIQATAPHAAASFRQPLALGDFSVSGGSATFGNLSYTPKTNGDTDMSVQATVTASGLCQDSLLGGLVCGLLGPLLATPHTINVQFPQLATASLAGSKLTNAAKNGHAGPFALLTPVAGDPNYWFITNEWYRYTYYAVAPVASASQSGGYITVSGFPVANGSTNDKNFVLTVMGPAVTGQVRSPTAALSQYVEGQNAVTTPPAAPPRTFAYQVYTVSGNDRIATCPFTDGTTPCD